MRRVDPEARTLGRFFAEEIAAPLGLEVYFGAPTDLPRERLARIERVPAWKALPQARDLPRPMALAMLNPGDRVARRHWRTQAAVGDCQRSSARAAAAWQVFRRSPIARWTPSSSIS